MRLTFDEMVEIELAAQLARMESWNQASEEIRASGLIGEEPEIRSREQIEREVFNHLSASPRHFDRPGAVRNRPDKKWQYNAKA